jgi:hypothetical protein
MLLCSHCMGPLNGTSVVSKRKSLHLSIPPLGPCDNPYCHDGFVRGMFSSSSCYKCEGSGLVHKETKEAIDKSVMIAAMKLCIRKQRQEIKRLEANQKPPAEFNPYGDVPDRHGGKFRMD